MKKLLAFCLMLSGVAVAGPENPDFSPVYLSSAGTNTRVLQPTLINYNYPGSGQRNCITDIALSGDSFPAAGQTLYILDGIPNGTTAYQIGLATGTVIEDFYPQNPLCLSYGATTYVYVSTGNFKLNLGGYQRQ